MTLVSTVSHSLLSLLVLEGLLVLIVTGCDRSWTLFRTWSDSHHWFRLSLRWIHCCSIPALITSKTTSRNVPSITSSLFDILSHDLIDGSLIIYDNLISLFRINSSLSIDWSSRFLTTQLMSTWVFENAISLLVLWRNSFKSLPLMHRRLSITNAGIIIVVIVTHELFCCILSVQMASNAIL